MTTRAKLQEKSLDELRTIAAAIDVPDHASLQKSKLIAAILDSDKFEVSEEPAPVDVPDIVPRRSAETSDSSDDDPQPRSNQLGGGRPSQGPRDYEDRGNRRRSRRGGRPGGPDRPDRSGGQQGGGGDSSGEEKQQWDESDLEDRQGILDILPEGYGFLRCTGYLPGDKDVYVSATQVRKFGLRRGDILSGPVRPPRSQQKFAALTRIEHVSGMTVEEARRRPKR